MSNGDKAYQIVLDESWVFLDARKNPVTGRKITFQLPDGTLSDVDVTMSEYGSPATVKAKILEKVKAHNDLMA